MISINTLFRVYIATFVFYPFSTVVGYGPNLGIKSEIHQMLLITHESQIDYPTFKKKLNPYRYSYV